MKRAIKIIKILEKHLELPRKHFASDPFKILISTVLSQRTKDISTEVASKRLFEKFDNAKKLSKAKTRQIEQLIKNVGFYRVKAKRIKRISQQLISEYKGKVPSSIEELLKLPGVGRKTANCVLVFGFRIPAIPVDSHLRRVSNRIGLVRTKTPEQTEKALEKIIPKKYWLKLNTLFITHGKLICQPRKPLCFKCPIVELCDYKPKNLEQA